MKVECVLDSACALGEGPYWDRAGGRLIFVDIVGKRGHIFSPDSGKRQIIDFPEVVSAVIPRAGGGYIATLETRVVTVGADGALADFATGYATPGTRSNEARTDSRGRLWLGTMEYPLNPDGSHGAVTRSIGTLQRVDPDGSVTRFLDGIGISNTLVWSPDDTILYFADSITNQMTAYGFDAEAGIILDSRPFVSGAPGETDGSAMDEEGCIWNTRWDASCLIRYRPDGAEDRRIEMPVKRPTSAVFGGPDLSTLFITSARMGITEPGPLDGAVLAIQPGVKGLPCYPFAG
jgi:sugar lactone lactonase YvrE